MSRVMIWTFSLFVLKYSDYFGLSGTPCVSTLFAIILPVSTPIVMKPRSLERTVLLTRLSTDILSILELKSWKKGLLGFKLRKRFRPDLSPGSNRITPLPRLPPASTTQLGEIRGCFDVRQAAGRKTTTSIRTSEELYVRELRTMQLLIHE